jgi:predicted ATPase/class 3 adenylate cyclase
MSDAQPSGTVTLVFTDVEGSTKLLEELGADAYRAALAEHRRVMREAFGAHRGYEVDYEGDGFFYAFASAQAAVSAVREAIVGLEAGPIRIRVGIHTGEPSLDPPKYVGMDVHRAARIMSAAHGGQVVLSPSTVALLDPDSFDLTDLGEHRFKDLSAPQRVFQLGEGEFSPIRSLHRTNLPVPATPFIGRESELAAVAGMLGEPEARLVSLVGPGGTGKTRLALQASAEASDAYPDGVFWAPLAPLRDPALVLPTVAAALSVREGQDGSTLDDLARALAGRRLLVFVDNVEHLMPDAADLVGAFVEACPTVTTVVTTRERLQLPSERVYAVPPMNENDAEALFRSRAAAVGAELDASAELRTLCERLDNLPLALELAAARTMMFSPAQLLDRLSQRLDLLKARRGVDPRQETLRSTIAWSHDLLDADEQTLFRRMSVFAGTCSLESAEQIAGADLDLLQSLLDKSLLRRRDGTRDPRFWMLETIREFAAEQLATVGESNELRRRHLDHYAALAEECFDETLTGNDDLDRLEEEQANLRLALDTALSDDPARALELGHWLIPLWQRRGEFREGRERLAAALSRAPDVPRGGRAWALRDAAFFAGSQGDLPVAESLGHEALALFRELGDQRGRGLTLIGLGMTAINRNRRDPGEARRLFEEAVDALGGTGDERLYRRALMSLAISESIQEHHARARALLRDVVAGARRDGSPLDLALAVINLGASEENAGERDAARQHYEEAIALSRREGRKPTLAVALCNVGHLLRANTPSEALAYFSESLKLARQMEEPRTIAECLDGGAGIFAAQGRFTEAATMLGAASSIRVPTGLDVSPGRKRYAEAAEAQCREALSTEAFARAWDEGSALDAIVAADWALRRWEETE